MEITETKKCLGLAGFCSSFTGIVPLEPGQTAEVADVFVVSTVHLSHIPIKISMQICPPLSIGPWHPVYPNL